MILILIAAHPEKLSKLCKSLLMQNVINSLHIKLKREQEMYIPLTESDWYSMCKILQSSTSSRARKEFG